MPSPCQECGDPTVGRGLCKRHYGAWYRANQLTSEKRLEYQRRYWDRHGERESIKRRKPKVSKVCEECGTPFETGISLQRFCQRSCEKRANKRRHPTPRKTVNAATP